MIIRPGVPGDRAAIAAIQTESSEASQWTPDHFLVAECESRIAGFLVTRQVATAEFEILNLAVAVDFRRRGVGAALVRHALHACPGMYFLEVRESNTAAKHFYRSLGFEQCGTRPKYYAGPEDNAIVMRIRS